jgi:hypothetical protein
MSHARSGARWAELGELIESMLTFALMARGELRHYLATKVGTDRMHQLDVAQYRC